MVKSAKLSPKTPLFYIESYVCDLKYMKEYVISTLFEDYKCNLYIFINFYRFIWKYIPYIKNSGTATFVGSKYEIFLRTTTFIKNLVPGTLLSKILATYRYKVALCSHESRPVFNKNQPALKSQVVIKKERLGLLFYITSTG